MNPNKTLELTAQKAKRALLSSLGESQTHALINRELRIMASKQPVLYESLGEFEIEEAATLRVSSGRGFEI